MAALQVNGQNEFCGKFTPTYPPPSPPPTPSSSFNSKASCTAKRSYSINKKQVSKGFCVGDEPILDLRGGRKNCGKNNTIFCATITLDLKDIGKPPRNCMNPRLESRVSECGKSSKLNIALYLKGKCSEKKGVINLGRPTRKSITFTACSNSYSQNFKGFKWVCPPPPPPPVSSPPPCDKKDEPCNDGKACTINDKYDENCNCRGESVGIPGEFCDDGDDCTINDTLTEDCLCIGEPGPDSDNDGVLDCEDDCPYDMDGMVDADIKCGVAIKANNFSGQSFISNYGECTATSMAMGRELVYRLNNTSQSDIVITFKEKSHLQLRKLNLLIVTDPCTPKSCLADYAINAPIQSGQNPEKIVLKDAAPGVYYIIVDGNMPTATNDFELLVECTGGSAASCPENAHYVESFEDYRKSKGITTLDASHWETVGNSSGSGLISNDQASNGEQSLEFNRFEGGAQDINLALGKKFKGSYRIAWDMFIQPMGSAHFGLFGGDNSDPWGSIGHTFRMMATKYQGKWFNVEIYVDMDENKYTLYMDNRHFEESGKYYLNLHHLNFYSPPGGHFYVDNICYAEVESIPDTDSETSDDRRQDNYFTDDLTLFPNPATEEVLVDLRKYEGKEVDLVIYNAMSFEVYRKHIPQVGETAERISLNNFTNGLYIVNVKGKGVRAKAKKLIVSRLY